MDREQTLFLTAIKDCIHGRATAVSDTGTDWERFYALGRRHHLTALLYDQLREQIPVVVGERFRSDYMAQVVQSRQRRRITGELTELLEATVRDYFYIKGDVAASLYPNPEVRSMCDVDVMIHREEMQPLAQTLQNAGFTLEEQGVSVWAYTKQGIAIEIHDTLIESTHREDDDVAFFTGKCWEYVQNRELDWSFHLIYLLLHLRKHFRSRGVGFRQFLDVALVTRKVPLDWDFIRREMEGLGLWRFTLTVLELCRQWFDCGPLPEPLALELEPDFVGEAAQAIFANGVFGFGNEENAENEIINTGRNEGLPGLLGKAWRIIFPPYREMYETERYAFVKGRPWLLPAAWLYRIVAVSREGKLSKMLRDLFQFRKKVQQRSRVYDEWGL